MRKLNATLNVAGDGLWSRVTRPVNVIEMDIGYRNRKSTFGELRVYFDTETWDVNKDGLIYTDKGFMREMREFLKAHGIAGDDVSYSEQGMQGDDYVSCDVGVEFFATWGRKFGVDLTAVVKKQQDDFNARWGLTA